MENGGDDAPTWSNFLAIFFLAISILSQPLPDANNFNHLILSSRFTFLAGFGPPFFVSKSYRYNARIVLKNWHVRIIVDRRISIVFPHTFLLGLDIYANFHMTYSIQNASSKRRYSSFSSLTLLYSFGLFLV